MHVGIYNAIIRTKKRTNKHGNIRTEYNGRKYHSKKEAQYARDLDLLTKAANPAQRVVKWEPQVPYRLDIKKMHICKYILDFKVEYADGRIEHVDVKGYKKGNAYSMFQLKKKMMLACHGIEVIEK